MARKTARMRARYVSPRFQKSLARTGLEQITGAPYGFHINRTLWIGFDFLAETPHVYVDTAWCHKSFGPPNTIEKLITGEDAVRPSREKIEQTKLERAHGNRFSSSRDTIGRRIDPQGANFNRLVRRGSGIGSPQKGLHSGDKLSRAERFRYVVIGAKLESHHTVGFFTLRCQNQNRQPVQAD